MRTRIIAGVLAGVLIVGFGFSVAAAARLDVATSPGITFTQEHRCAAAMEDSSPVIDTTNGSGTEVTVSNVPSACIGLGLTVNLHSADGTIIASGTVAQAQSIQGITVGAYDARNVTAAVATLGGWIFPTDWVAAIVGGAYCNGIDASGNVTADACTLTFTYMNTYAQNGYWVTQLQFTADTAAYSWRVTFDFSDTAYFQGFTPVKVGHYYGVKLAAGYSCSQLPIFRGESSNPEWPDRHGNIVITNDPAFYMSNQLCPAP